MAVRKIRREAVAIEIHRGWVKVVAMSIQMLLEVTSPPKEMVAAAWNVASTPAEEEVANDRSASEEAVEMSSPPPTPVEKGCTREKALPPSSAARAGLAAEKGDESW